MIRVIRYYLNNKKVNSSTKPMRRITIILKSEYYSSSIVMFRSIYFQVCPSFQISGLSANDRIPTQLRLDLGLDIYTEKSYFLR